MMGLCRVMVHGSPSGRVVAPSRAMMFGCDNLLAQRMDVRCQFEGEMRTVQAGSSSAFFIEAEVVE